MVHVVKNDLQFILKQIKIAEEHAAGGNLADIVAREAPNAAGLLPHGLRTVDGSYNNLAHETWGAADEPFKHLLPPDHINEGDEQPFFGVSNTDYGIGGNVVDSDPRTISNLIADQSLRNPAARAAIAGDQGLEIDTDGDGTPDTAFIPNVAPDEGLSSPFNGWMTLFGQFFDHGLDLVSKGGNGTVFIPLKPDDPLYVPGSQTNFMALTRLSPDPVNLTTSWVDQNQTYASTASKQIFMREYVIGPVQVPDATAPGGVKTVQGPVATGHLLEGAKGGLATWDDIQEQARTMLGIELRDSDVTKVPLVASDAYGNFIPGPNGRPQLVVGLGGDGVLGTADDVLREGNPQAPVNTDGVAITGHAFLDDIAHAAVPNAAGTHDSALLGRHYVTGDGRGNENIGLTAVHHVFHTEHNRIVEETKRVALESNDLAFLNEWLLVDVAAMPATQAQRDALVWDGERLFQSGRFVTEMEYQHLVFEEFARKVHPAINAFVFNNSEDVDPTISAEFANVVYRFGHSMLTENVDIIKMAAGVPVETPGMKLLDAFLNPDAYNALDDNSDLEAAGAIIRGMTRQVGNEIDEFVTPALQNNLLGLPLDLPALNIARGRDAGMQTLNEARGLFHAMTGDAQLKPYANWIDFAKNLGNYTSIINFMAAYGTHSLITGESTMVGKRAAASALLTGQTMTITDDPETPNVDEADNPATADVVELSREIVAPADRFAFLNGTGAYADRLGGLNDVDFWMGGLAEKKLPFGSMLGSTFAFVFEVTMEQLQNADRFYYLSRTQGLNLLNELENNSFSKLIMGTTDLGGTGNTALPADAFAAVSIILEMDKAKQIGPDPVQTDPKMPPQNLVPMVDRKDLDGDNDPDFIEVTTNEHVVIGGTDEGDRIISGGGDDAVWGRGGNDTIEAGNGVDKVHGEEGDDIITNKGTDIGETDFLHGDDGNDVISGGDALNLLFGNNGSDVLITSPDDAAEAFGGFGEDFIYGGAGSNFLLGNEGDDWIESGDGFDTSAGDNSQLFFNSDILGHDVMFAGRDEHDFDAESGDDIMVQGESVMRSEGMFGFDWAIWKGDGPRQDGILNKGGNSEQARPDEADLARTQAFPTDAADVLRDRFDHVEALSGWDMNDVLKGDSRTNVGADPTAPESALFTDELTQAGVDRITGLRALLGDWVAPASANPEATIAFDAGNILIGGGGSDNIEGRGGNDLIDGDSWLDVRIRVGGATVGFADSITGKVRSATGAELYAGRTLDSLMLDATVNPSALSIERRIVKDDGVGDTDVAVFSDAQANYDFVTRPDGSILVTHARGTQADGVDMLRNIEQAQFSDSLRNFAAAAPVVATAGNDTLAGDAQANSIDGLAGNDSISGLGGDDTLIGGLGIDTLVGGTGNDRYILAAGTTQGPDVITELAGEGTDTVEANFAFSFGATASLANLENVVLKGTGNFGSTGNALANGLTGNSGANNLQGGVGNDTLTGAGGNDTLNGGGNTDTAVFSGARSEYTITFNATTSTYTVVDSVAGRDGTDSVTLVESFSFTDGVRATGALGIATSGNDTIGGTAGNDSIDGLAGNDSISGLAGNDTLAGGLGTDTLVGGLGDDRYILLSGQGTDTITELAGEGNDTVEANFTFSIGSAANLNLENVVLTGTGVANATGNASNNSLTGNSAGNLLQGGGGNDTLTGAGGNDTLDGAGGNDLLVFGAGFGSDRVQTSGGLASFDFNPTGGQDLLDIQALGVTAATFAAQVTIAQSGLDTLVTVGGGTITLVGMTAANITQTDFILAP